MQNSIANFNNFLLDKSICIVGAAPNMKDSCQGSFIDSHDVVVRFNNFHCDKEHVKDVGSKMDIYVSNFVGVEHKYKEVIEKNTKYFFCSYPDPDSSSFSKTKKFKRKSRRIKLQEFKNSEYYKIWESGFLWNDPFLLRKLEEEVSKPRTGIIFIDYLLKMCSFKNTHILGFSFIQEQNQSHYYGNKRPKNVHNVVKEYDYLLKIINNNPKVSYSFFDGPL